MESEVNVFLDEMWNKNGLLFSVSLLNFYCFSFLFLFSFFVYGSRLV